MKDYFLFVSGLVIGGLLFTALEEWIAGWAIVFLYVIGLPAMAFLFYRWMKLDEDGESKASK